MTDKRMGCTPWVGEAYRCGPRIAVVAESTYGAPNEWREKSADALVYHWTQRVPERARRSGLLPRVAKLLLDLSPAERLSDAAYTDVYRRTAFWNFIPGLVGRKPGDRPSLAHWAMGAELFPVMLNRLTPTALLVVGKATWQHLPSPAASDWAQLGAGLRAPRKWFEVAGVQVPAMYINHTASRGWRHGDWQSMVCALLACACPDYRRGGATRRPATSAPSEVYP